MEEIAANGKKKIITFPSVLSPLHTEVAMFVFVVKRSCFPIFELDCLDNNNYYSS